MGWGIGELEGNLEFGGLGIGSDHKKRKMELTILFNNPLCSTQTHFEWTRAT
jgi:hypothetical protein